MVTAACFERAVAVGHAVDIQGHSEMPKHHHNVLSNEDTGIIWIKYDISSKSSLSSLVFCYPCLISRGLVPFAVLHSCNNSILGAVTR